MHLKTEDPKEIFAEAIEYFKAATSQCQIGGATSPYSFCTYLNVDGQRCVAGHFVVDETAADQRFLQEFKGSVLRLNTHAHLTDAKEALELLTNLQRAHDVGVNWDDNGRGSMNSTGWARLREVGEVWGFDTSEIPE